MLATHLLSRDGLSDAQLLEGFVVARDETAFRALVDRHGRMVLGVCRRVLGNHHDAEDAFQATFLVLARRARAAPGERLGPWLHGIALRTALKARVAAGRRRLHEGRAARQRPILVEESQPDSALGPILDEEIRRLPAPLRTVVLLCDMQGHSRRCAARQLRCPESTLSSRLAVARQRLARRLSRRGIMPCLSGLALTVPHSLARRTTRMALDVAGEVPAEVTELTTEVIRAMTWTRKTTLAAVALMLALAGGTLVAVAATSHPQDNADALATGDQPATVASADRFRFLASDGFDGQLGLNWRPVRPDPTHVTLSSHPGRLTITTQRGSIHGPDLATAGSRAAKASPPDQRTRNIYVIDNPLAPDMDFTCTTCVVSFHQSKRYQQAGLILYTDDDHYLKWTYEFNDANAADFVKQTGQAPRVSDVLIGGLKAETKDLGDYRLARALLVHAADRGDGRPFFVAVAETDGEPVHAIVAEAEPNLPRVWLRIGKRGNLYDCSTSTDGRHFIRRGTVDWGKGGPRQVGLIAQNGGEPGVPEVEAQFEFFELRSP
jgi:RNA polymerase sigma factor (sigma-70 family)